MDQLELTRGCARGEGVGPRHPVGGDLQGLEHGHDAVERLELAIERDRWRVRGADGGAVFADDSIEQHHRVSRRAGHRPHRPDPDRRGRVLVEELAIGGIEDVLRHALERVVWKVAARLAQGWENSFAEVELDALAESIRARIDVEDEQAVALWVGVAIDADAVEAQGGRRSSSGWGQRAQSRPGY